MASLGAQKRQRVRSPAIKSDHDTDEHDNNISTLVRISRSEVAEHENGDVRKSNRKRTLKRFDNFYVGGDCDAKEVIAERVSRKKSDSRRAGRPAKSDGIQSNACSAHGNEMQNKEETEDVTNSARQITKTENTVICRQKQTKTEANHLERAQPAKDDSIKDQQVRKSNRKRSLKCFDNNFITDRKIPNKIENDGDRKILKDRHKDCKSSELVKLGTEIDKQCEKEVRVRDEERQVKEETVQNNSQSAQSAEELEMHKKRPKNTSEEETESTQPEGHSTKSSDKTEQTNEVNGNTSEGSEPENNPSLQNGQKVRRRKYKNGNSRPRECHVCLKVFQKLCDLTKHMLIHTGQKPFACDVCGKRFTQMGNMRAHKLVHSGEKRFKCDTCGWAFARAGDLKSHKLTHSEVKPYVCDVCSKAFKTADYLKSHKETHSNPRRFTCDICGKGFSKFGGLKAHKIIHSGVKSFKCSICPKSFYSAGNLKEHELVHTGSKPCKCDVCGKRFTKKSSLKKHMMLHTGEKPFSCNECGKGYTNKSELEIHERTHTGERPYQCKQCVANFHRKANLQQHVSAVHLGIRPHVCDACGKAFTEARCLKEHLLIHSGVKPHHCQHCGKSFTQSSTLKAHLRSHSGAKPYLCEYCGKPFSDVSSRNRHHRIHTGEKPYKCPRCSAAFSRLEVCKNHMNHEHNIKTERSPSVIKLLPADHSYDVPVAPPVKLESVPEEGQDADSVKFVAPDVDESTDIVQLAVSEEQQDLSSMRLDVSGVVNNLNTVQLASDEYSGVEHLVITVTDGTQIVLQTSVDNLPQISEIQNHLTADHPYVVTSGSTPVETVDRSTDDSGLTVIELQVLDEGTSQEEKKLHHANSTSDVVFEHCVSEISSNSAGGVLQSCASDSVLGFTQSDCNNVSASVAVDSQNAQYTDSDIIHSLISQSSGLSCLPVSDSQADYSSNITSFAVVKSEPGNDGVSESMIFESQVSDIDTLGSVNMTVKSEEDIDNVMSGPVKSEEDIDNVMSGPVILDSQIDTSGLTFAVVNSEGEEIDLSGQRIIVSHIENLDEMSTPVSVILESQVGRHDDEITNADDDNSHVEQLVEVQSNHPSIEPAQDSQRTILRNLLTDPHSRTAAKTQQSVHTTDKSAEGQTEPETVEGIRMKKRRYAAMPKSFFCEICGFGFTQASSLKKHQILLHSNEKPFVCEVCQKVCTSRSELEAHMRSHTGEKPFKCQQCGVALKRKANLEQHIRAVHMQHRPYSCDACGRKFTEARSLKEHRLIHIGARPHKCSYCNKAFTQLGTLKKHERTHSGLKPFMCSFCAKDFNDSAALQRHIRLHTGERPYKCEHCPSAFFRSEQLKNHKRNEHPDSLDDLASIALARM